MKKNFIACALCLLGGSIKSLQASSATQNHEQGVAQAIPHHGAAKRSGDLAEISIARVKMYPDNTVQITYSNGTSSRFIRTNFHSKPPIKHH